MTGFSSPRPDEGFGYPLGFVGAVAATAVSVAAGAAGHHLYAVVALTLVIAWVSATTSVRAALGTAVVAWGLLAGFVIGRTGLVVFDGESARDAVVFTASGLLVGGLAAALHAVRTHAARATVRVSAIPAQSTATSPSWRAASNARRTPVAGHRR
jgi:hypothetical protein